MIGKYEHSSPFTEKKIPFIALTGNKSKRFRREKNNNEK